jgi:small nuclear ribonucleoprotein
MTTESRPFDHLNSWVGKSVLVLMKGNVKIRGKLMAFDIHMNVVLDDAELLEEDNSVKVKYGKAMLRGDSLIMITP